MNILAFGPAEQPGRGHLVEPRVCGIVEQPNGLGLSRARRRHHEQPTGLTVRAMGGGHGQRHDDVRRVGQVLPLTQPVQHFPEQSACMVRVGTVLAGARDAVAVLVVVARVGVLNALQAHRLAPRTL
ncbi:hypothetical protein [Humibacillus xanthopallidus]|uniref:hypothetical protein n=1 Tax=Humibacillus xanthopallidus TaxID=412689 RepID=UPI001151EF65|nr:hypothetical protein [Humibacillus xanthopallidus]